ncbi:MAG: YtxH domain-containing protein, partial [Syntrophorhabdus sp.]
GQQDSGIGTGSIILSFFIGGIIGAGVALLMAPKTGEETRKMIRDFADDARDRAGDYVGQVKEKASTYMDKGKEILDREKNVISRAVEAGKEAYDRERQG